ncbi:MAG: PKD domain-containing protein [Bacteroidota bacterium]
MKRVILTFLMTGLLVGLQAQQKVAETKDATWLKRSAVQHSSQAIQVSPAELKDWGAYLKNYGIKHGSDVPTEDLEQWKNDVARGKRGYQPDEQVDATTFARTAQSATPVLIDDFEGNSTNGSTPPDNHVAISDSGFIVSVTNTRIDFYNETGTRLRRTSLGAFDAPLSVSSFAFDPRVVYDADSKKFIMCWLAGSSSARSDVVMAVSTSQDPRDPWNLYALDATLLNNGTWLDFPYLATNENEIFISGNLFTDGAGFDQVLVYQIDKADAIAGNPLTFLTYNGVAGSNSGIFSLMPLMWGYDGSNGPEMYFISRVAQNALDLFKLSGDIASNPSFSVTRVTVPQINNPPNGLQLGSTELVSTGDSRMQDGFVSDSLAHVVFGTSFENDYAGIYYIRINLFDFSIEQTVYGQEGFDCAFPAVAPFAVSTSDPTVLIGFLRTGETIYPQLRAVSIDAKMDPSGSVLIKKGTTPLNTFLTGTERWGDYTGTERRHNATSPEVWVFGCYPRSASNFQGFLDGWIGKLSDSGVPSSAPVADFSSSAPAIGVGRTVRFSDESTNNPTSWNWTLAGGTPAQSSDQNPLVQYNTPGVYPVTLTVSNAAGTDSLTATTYVTVTALPITNFSADQLIVPAGSDINFTDLSGNNPSGWLWIFDGGTPNASFNQNPTINYQTPGTYDVNLTATNSGGSAAEQKGGYITVVPLVAPTAAFRSDTTIIDVGGAVQFIDESVDFPLTWSWDFTGGIPATSSDRNPLVSYANPGTYQVILSVSNAAGTDLEVKNSYITVLADQNTSIQENVVTEVNVFPNPIKEGQVTADFYLEKSQYLRFSIFDIAGKEVGMLGDGKIKAGQNRLGFLIQDMAAGTYFLQARNEDQKVIINEKIVVLP